MDATISRLNLNVYTSLSRLFVILSLSLAAIASNPPEARAGSSILGLPSLEELENPNPDLASLVYSEDGVLLHKFFLKNRTFVPLRTIPMSVRNALIATEDVEFYRHWGVDMRRLVLAMGENILKGRTRWHGASTITQQLAKNLFLSQERTVTRKMKEFVTAVELEKTYTKNEILALYLNTVYFGSGAYGVEAASRTYFGKPASQLNLPESATLIATLKNPTAYNPAKNPAGSIGRRNLILSLMAKEKFITEAQAAKAKQARLVLKYTPATHHGAAPYFTEYIRQTVKPASMLGDVNLYRDGLTIQTTLDSRMQKYAEAAAREHLATLQATFDQSWRWTEPLKNQLIRESARYKEMREEDGLTDAAAMAKLKRDRVWLNGLLRDKTRIQVALVAIDPSNGHVKAWVGGNQFASEDYKYQFDHIWQARRQPGSTFKPFVYTAAIDKGIPANFQVLDKPLSLQSGGGIWSPRNSDGSSGGWTTLRSAIARSLNQVTVRLAYEQLSTADIISYARRMGISSPIPSNLSIALGTAEVSPLELAGAFSTFANNGVWNQPVSILRVEDKNHHLISEYVPNSRFAIDSTTNFVMVSMLKDVINKGTGIAVRARYGLEMEAAGKTGTTQSLRDAWFAGFTPQLVAVVWTGFDDERIKFTSMEYGQGARASLPIWAGFMKRCYADPSLGLENRYFRIPENVIAVPISSTSNRPSDLFDSDVYIEYFTPKGFQNYQQHPERTENAVPDTSRGPAAVPAEQPSF
ncbi:penicillin-binding protein 1A [Pelodictyon luteolum]|uniref:Penicillin-binding protein 1A n=1 Tax=Chlorobium luteolum (strain DSM 273 / BCRC 81028 / 2530) TaxID=319225 RepID=Q3B1J4_CHLL3|nr:PBP1A family penicillin-binding protein [Pelodictyon luteolum]ABB24787.1 Penicillin-binding protein 1A [Pelodictyon luteolum DSM 273]